MPLVTLLTDFGHDDAFVGIMKGVILGIHPQARLVDLTHAVEPHDVMRAALILRSAVKFFPPQTVHVAVVDPGVGSARRPLLIRTARAVLIGPDNGVLSLAAQSLAPWEAFELQNRKYFLEPVSRTFHGRDIFAPVAAHASAGVGAESFGAKVDSMIELHVAAPLRSVDAVRGEVIYVDRFGNLITNIDRDALASFRGCAVSVSIGDNAVAGPVAAYADVEEGTALALVGSWDVLEIAVRNGSAARDLNAGCGTPVIVKERKT